MIAYDSIQEIEYFRLRALRGALKLEMIGMKRKGRSVYSILKEEFHGLLLSSVEILKDNYPQYANKIEISIMLMLSRS